MKPLVSVRVPVFNGEKYIEKSIRSIANQSLKEIEIICVDDGSTDKTAEIADEYVEKYPTICRAIHQANGGHGDAVMTGIKNATGVFFKVVDSDDRVDPDALNKLMSVMRKNVLEKHPLDMLISNYVYDKQGVKRKKVMRYASVLPQDTYFTWEDIGHFKKTQYMLMHSIIYRQ